MDSADNIDPTNDLRAECQQLRKEVSRLHQFLRENGIDPFLPLSAPTNSASSPTEQTTTLWRNSRKTDAVSPAPPDPVGSSSAVWRRASASFALSTNHIPQLNSVFHISEGYDV
jgi:hypothetical protein